MTDKLTAREIQVLRLIADGHTTDEMAKILGVTSRSITGQRDSLMVKLNARNAPHAVTRGHERGYLPGGRR